MSTLISLSPASVPNDIRLAQDEYNLNVFTSKADFGPRCAINPVKAERYLDQNTILPDDEFDQKQPIN
jgi:hypothetical protein